MGAGFSQSLVQDVRFAARGLRKEPLFTAVAIIVLAIGIGGNTVVFSVVNALLLNPFPYPSAARLVEIKSRATDGTAVSTVPVPDFGFWRTEGTAFEAIEAFGWFRANLAGQPGAAEPEQIVIGTATAGFLRVLGVQPALGRFFLESEDRPGGPAVVVLGHGSWVRRFGGRKDVLGQTLTLNGTVHTIVGVMPARLPLPGTITSEIWRPAAYDIAANMQPGYNTRYDGDNVVARLKPDVSRARAEAELNVISQRLAQRRHAGHAPSALVLLPLGTDLAQSERNRLRVLGLIVATGLLLACANLAGLLLARHAGRSEDLAVRAALGASRSRLVRYTLTETLLLAVVGGSLGIGIAASTVRLVGAAAPPFIGLDSALRIDWIVLTFALGVSLLTGILFGLVPAVHGSRPDVMATLKKMSVTGAVRTRRTILSTVVIGQISLALPLLVGGALLSRSFIHLMRVDTGVRAEGVLTFRISLAGPRYSTEASRLQLFGALIERLRGVPGVTAAGAVNPLPMSREYSGGGFTIEGQPAPANWRDMAAQYCQATPDYFRTIGVPVLRGREFTAADAGQPVVLINDALARRFFAGTNPLGDRLSRLGTIVGVVGDVRHNGPANDPPPQIYYPFASRPPRTMAVVVRGGGDPLQLSGVVRQQVHELDPTLPVDRIKPMATVVRDATADVRIVTNLVVGFALFALALAAIGVYGVIASSVNQRRREIGIRLALGASRGQVAALVVGRGALLTSVGILIGVPVTLTSSQLMASLLYGVSPRDVGVYLAVALLLFAVALLASFLPGYAASKISPVDALRSD